MLMDARCQVHEHFSLFREIRTNPTRNWIQSRRPGSIGHRSIHPSSPPSTLSYTPVRAPRTSSYPHPHHRPLRAFTTPDRLIIAPRILRVGRRYANHSKGHRWNARGRLDARPDLVDLTLP